MKYKRTANSDLMKATKLTLFIFVLCFLLLEACNEKKDLSTNTVTDIDGNVYNTVTIGTQVWMKENLKVTKYRNGDAIPNVTDSAQWANLTTEAWCYYNNDTSNNAAYGKLYNGYSIADSRNLCPAGWHIPTDAEWTILIDYLGGETVAGGKMKEAGTSHWSGPNTGADNSSGFTAIPGGHRSGFGEFKGRFGHYNYGYWCSKENDGTYASRGHSLDYYSNSVGPYGDFMRGGFSVRCVRDTVSLDD
jgi:uncharacterized protein (TIGR02145 family)